MFHESILAAIGLAAGFQPVSRDLPGAPHLRGQPSINYAARAARAGHPLTRNGRPSAGLFWSGPQLICAARPLSKRGHRICDRNVRKNMMRTRPDFSAQIAREKAAARRRLSRAKDALLGDMWSVRPRDLLAACA